MMVLVLNAAPRGLRGALTKWLMEVSPGVFVGNPSRRIREELWKRVQHEVNDGRAVLVWSSDGEQRLRFDVHQHSWKPVDVDGLTLIRRPPPENDLPERRTGWSQARGRRHALRPRWRDGYNETAPEH